MRPNEFANLLLSYKEDVINAWMYAVRNDPRIHSDERLPEYALRDHVSAIIEEICHLLREGETPGASNTREAHVHAYLRYRQGYRGRELACELSQLRRALFEVVADSLADIEIGARSLIKLSETVHLYIDEEIRYAFSIYTEAERETPPLTTQETEMN
jgi:hypothetical protein